MEGATPQQILKLGTAIPTEKAEQAPVVEGAYTV